MPAPTHTVTPPARSTGRGVQSRLPWWALALPLVAFGALLLVPVSASGPEEDTASGSPVAQVLDRVQQVLSGG